MKIGNSRRCEFNIPEAIEIQSRLAKQVVTRGELNAPRFVAGVDISVKRTANFARAAVVVLSFPGLEHVETKMAEGPLDFPYVPGLLSFREIPLSFAVCKKLNISPDVFLIDGQGLAHPRRFGFACHIGLLLDKPTIGCAKSLLLGKYEEPGVEPGSHSEIIDKDELIGAAVRTRRNIRPVYVSIGHKIDLAGSIDMILKCCKGYRIPEPLRLAHVTAGK